MKKFLKRLIHPLSSRWVYTARTGPAAGMRVRGGFLFLPKVPPKEMPLLLHVARYLEGRVAYDVGANIGLTTLFLARSVGERGTVIAFEPTPPNADRLVENVRLNQFNNVRLYRVALGEVASTATIVHYPEAVGIATLREDLNQRYRRQYQAHEFQIEVMPLDTLIMRESLPIPDFVKIDIEGYEYPMLLGARETVEKARPMIFVELHSSSPEDRERNWRAVYNFLNERGYAIYAADRASIDGTNLQNHGNCWLAIPRESLETNMVQSP